MSIVQTFVSTVVTMDSSFFFSILIGYAVKIIKNSCIVGVFLAGLNYLWYHQIINIKWNKLQWISRGTLTTLANISTYIQSIGNTRDQGTGSLTMTCFSIPFTASMSCGFTIGFLKGWYEQTMSGQQKKYAFLYKWKKYFSIWEIVR